MCITVGWPGGLITILLKTYSICFFWDCSESSEESSCLCLAGIFLTTGTWELARISRWASLHSFQLSCFCAASHSLISSSVTAFPSPIPLWFSFPGNKLLSLSPAGIREDMNLSPATCFTNIIISSLEHLGLHSLSLARASWGQVVCFHLVPLVPQPDLYRYLRIAFLLSVISLPFCLQFSYILTYNCPYSCPKMSYNPFSKDGVWNVFLVFVCVWPLRKKGDEKCFYY